MTETVTIKELRTRGGEVVDRLRPGSVMTVTRDGRPVAELRALPAEPVTAAALVERFRRLPAMDPDALRRDVDTVLDQSL